MVELELSSRLLAAFVGKEENGGEGEIK